MELRYWFCHGLCLCTWSGARGGPRQGTHRLHVSLHSKAIPDSWVIWLLNGFNGGEGGERKLSLCSHSVVSLALQPHGLQHTCRFPCPSPTLGVWSNSCPSSWWYHPTISSSVIPFSSSLQSFPAPGSFPMNQTCSLWWPKYWSFSFNISPSNEH